MTGASASTAWDRRAFGLALRSRREAMGVSLRQAEKDTGLSCATVSRIEAAKLAGTMDSVAILARWAGLTLDPFMTRNGGP